MACRHVLTDEEKNKILHEVQSAALDTLQKLKENYPDIHWLDVRYKKMGDSILHVASQLGYVEIVKYLLENFEPVCVDCKNKDDKTPLHEAAQFSQYEVCKVLIKHGAKVNALKRADWTPLMLACTKIQETSSYKTVEVLLNNNALVNYTNKDGWTALHLICREGDRQILELLIKHGLDIFSVTKNGRTALHVACLHGHLEIVKMLINMGLSVNAKDKCENIPLHEAILGGSIDVCRYLITEKHYANVLEKNSADFTILHLAASTGNLSMIAYIVKDLKVHVNVPNKNGLTPLHCAAKNKKLDAYKFLLSLKADEDAVDNFGRVAKDYLN